MNRVATIDVIVGDDGKVFAELRATRGIGAYRSGSFATCDALMHGIAPLVAQLRRDSEAEPARALIAGASPAGDIP